MTEIKYPENLLRDIGNYGWEKNEIVWEDTKDRNDGLNYALKCLTKKARDIILLRYKKGWQLKAIAEKYDTSPERIRRICRQALERLRYKYTIGYIVNGYKMESKKQRRHFYNREIQRSLPTKIRNMMISELGLETLPFYGLMRLGTHTVGQLVIAIHDPAWHEDVHCFGDGCIGDVYDSLLRCGALTKEDPVYQEYLRELELREENRKEK